MRSNREDAAPVTMGRGEVNGPSAFALFGDGDDAALFKANDDREAALYGDLLPDQRLLRRAGYNVHFVTKAGKFSEGRRTGFLACGKAVLSVRDFKAFAERERRRAAEAERAEAA